MRLYKLDNTVLELKGNATKLLSGLAANSLDKPFNAFLNQHGRIVATFRQEVLSEDDILIAVPQAVVSSFISSSRPLREDQSNKDSTNGTLCLCGC